MLSARSHCTKFASRHGTSAAGSAISQPEKQHRRQCTKLTARQQHKPAVDSSQNTKSLRQLTSALTCTSYSVVHFLGDPHSIALATLTPLSIMKAAVKTLHASRFACFDPIGCIFKHQAGGRVWAGFKALSSVKEDIWRRFPVLYHVACIASAAPAQLLSLSCVDILMMLSFALDDSLMALQHASHMVSCDIVWRIRAHTLSCWTPLSCNCICRSKCLMPSYNSAAGSCVLQMLMFSPDAHQGDSR